MTLKIKGDGVFVWLSGNSANHLVVGAQGLHDNIGVTISSKVKL